MSFQFIPIDTIKRIINIEIPGDFGACKKADFEAEFKRLPVSEAKNLIQQIQNKTADEDKVLRENVVNIAGVSDANGNPLTFNQELLSQLAEQAYIRAPLLAGFMEVNYSLEKLREKNSNR